MPSVQFLAAVDEAVAGSSELMGKLVATVRTNLQQRQKVTLNLLERDSIADSIRQLLGKESDLCRLYPIALREAFSNASKPRSEVNLSQSEVHFDQLELMEESQVQETVILARAQQVAVLAAESSLAELNTLVSSALGLKSVQAERNPFRPEIYIAALKSTMEEIGVSPALKLDWLAAMSEGLGKTLSQIYRDIAVNLRQRGVRAAGYAVTQVGAGQGVRTKQGGGKHATAPEEDPVLTLNKLRLLLSGNLTPQNAQASDRLEAFSRRFSQEFESNLNKVEPVQPDFVPTVPAAFEALSEMKQAGTVVDRLSARFKKHGTDISAAQEEPHTSRAKLKRSASNVAQALSLEVVSLMVDNMARDRRLLPAVQDIIRQLEPALMRLALVDPRFFSHKEHPARELLQEITQRSLAFEFLDSPGCFEYLCNLKDSLATLEDADIHDADPFVQVLDLLKSRWAKEDTARSKSLEEAVIALKHAEQRNILAEKIALDIRKLPDLSSVPESVIVFLCGPWAQVVAQARLAGGPDSKSADKYQALISAMLWSVHPELARKNITKLTRLVPLLISTLRDGLETIAYPAIKIGKFFEELMALHQLAFNQTRRPPESTASVAQSDQPSLRPQPLDKADFWVAPAEALASNFITLPDEASLPPSPASSQVDDSETAVHLADLPLGTWVELMHNEKWIRTQLTWSSPYGTLFLFTSSTGSPQSMSRRTVDKYLASGKLKVISDQPVVDEALDAVALEAMRNSVDSVI